ncbi:hypothetical protein [Erysipelothrix sp. strain 2 (EsS2-6-Brazil)]|uniref:hypothetical protein n=1 Tax=Erysipelothrix sp. strain 2 (EsS2-6-Brazil) TaxID=2500549 RepID=UPI00190C65DA|nr:hypothetical protein [Erysipelothrix sp. strain 2 (EsS2-6-Brazil)]MBK2402860.1 hypothetical protein [Erysipelothrix sp. strain 2 (EsS2-6-Brazil)]
MTLSQLIIGWFYYGIVFMGLSVLATFLLNKVTSKRWLPPLIINAVSILLLLGLAAKGLVPSNQQAYALYFIYMPVVAASVLYNGSLVAMDRIRIFMK